MSNNSLFGDEIDIMTISKLREANNTRTLTNEILRKDYL